jgi:hypothetical protein
VPENRKSMENGLSRQRPLIFLQLSHLLLLIQFVALGDCQIYASTIRAGRATMLSRKL